MIDSITIGGLRGFGEEKTITFAKPDKKAEGSGLTFIVGANNTGKTTIAEAVMAFNCENDSQSPTYSKDKRNDKYNNGSVLLKLKNTNGKEFTIKTVESGGSLTELSVSDGTKWESQQTYILGSRRSIQYEFSRGEQEKRNYLNNQLINQSSRNPYLQDFGYRLTKMNKAENRKKIDPILKEILGMDLEWKIDEYINHNCYLAIRANGIEHISEGMGDGVWSIFTICDALYDLNNEEALFIDEPELSLHPAYQKRVMKILKRVAKDKQIIINTHSPYFVDTECLLNGASIVRTHKNEEGNIEIHALANPKEYIKGLVSDLNQPHTFGFEAKEIFFQEDNIIVTEGQEDVVFYQMAAEELGMSLRGSFFGWGAGGANKITLILSILQKLGYKKVSAIYDGDKKEECEKAQKQFPEYKILIISQDDVRDKPEVPGKKPKNGLLTTKGEIKNEYKEEVNELFNNLNTFFGESI